MRFQAKSADSNAFRLLVSGAEGIAWYSVKDQKVAKREKLVYVQDLWLRGNSLSPDRDWLFLALYADTAVLNLPTRKLHYLSRSKRYSDGSYTLAIYHPLPWSPNSHYLLGRSSGAPADLVLFTPPRPGCRTLVKNRVWMAGWYPDSQSIWYVLEPKNGVSETTNRQHQTYYRLALKNKRASLISKQEVKRLLTDWDLLAFGWKQGLNDPYSIYHYTKDRQIRVGSRLEENPRALSVEQRNGKSVLLKAPTSVAMPLTVQDLSLDKQSLLVLTATWDYYVVHVPSQSWEWVFNSKKLHQGTDLHAEFTQSARLL